MSGKSRTAVSGSSGPAATSFERPRKSGYMTKHGGKGITANWKRRWFILDNHYLFYYSSPHEKDPLGIVCLGDYTDCRRVQSSDPKQVVKKNENMMVLKAAGGGDGGKSSRDYFIYPDSEEELASWLGVISAELTEARRAEKGSATLPSHVPSQARSTSVESTDGGVLCRGERALKKVDKKAFDEVTKLAAESSPLQHITVGRAKGPQRRKPRRYQAYDEDDADQTSALKVDRFSVAVEQPVAVPPSKRASVGNKQPMLPKAQTKTEDPSTNGVNSTAPSSGPPPGTPTKPKPNDQGPPPTPPLKEKPTDKGPPPDTPTKPKLNDQGPPPTPPPTEKPAAKSSSPNMPPKEKPADKGPPPDTPPKEKPADKGPLPDTPPKEKPADKGPPDTPPKERPADKGPPPDTLPKEKPADKGPPPDTLPKEKPADKGPPPDTPPKEKPADKGPPPDTPPKEKPADKGPPPDTPPKEKPADKGPPLSLSADDKSAVSESPVTTHPVTKGPPPTPPPEAKPTVETKAPPSAIAREQPLSEERRRSPEATPPQSGDTGDRNPPTPSDAAAKEPLTPPPSSSSPLAVPRGGSRGGFSRPLPPSKLKRGANSGGNSPAMPAKSEGKSKPVDAPAQEVTSSPMGNPPASPTPSGTPPATAPASPQPSAVLFPVAKPRRPRGGSRTSQDSSQSGDRGSSCGVSELESSLDRPCSREAPLSSSEEAERKVNSDKAERKVNNGKEAGLPSAEQDKVLEKKKKEEEEDSSTVKRREGGEKEKEGVKSAADQKTKDLSPVAEVSGGGTKQKSPSDLPPRKVEADSEQPPPPPLLTKKPAADMVDGKEGAAHQTSDQPDGHRTDTPPHDRVFSPVDSDYDAPPCLDKLHLPATEAVVNGNLSQSDSRDSGSRQSPSNDEDMYEAMDPGMEDREGYEKMSRSTAHLSNLLAGGGVSRTLPPRTLGYDNHHLRDSSLLMKGSGSSQLFPPRALSPSAHSSTSNSSEIYEDMLSHKIQKMEDQDFDHYPDSPALCLSQAKEVLHLARIARKEAEEMRRKAKHELELAEREKKEAELIRRHALEILKMAKERLPLEQK